MIENSKISKNRLENINSFYRITRRDALKHDEISELLEWKEKYLDRFEHNIDRKITSKFNKRIIMYLLYYICNSEKKERNKCLYI